MVTPYVVLQPDVLADATVGNSVPLDDDAHHHLVRVLRRRDGSPAVATDGSGREVDARLAGPTLQVDALRDVAAPTPRIEVAQALGKGRKHDEVVRMLTELGVDRVTAVTTARTQVDLSGKAARIRERWRAVADAACSQARRPHRPDVDGPVDLSEVLDGIDADPSATALLVADVTGPEGPLAVLDRLVGVRRVVVLVGPEGGLADHELAAVATAGGHAVSLGPTVLRTEHAAVVLAGIAAAATGRMDPVASTTSTGGDDPDVTA